LSLGAFPARASEGTTRARDEVSSAVGAEAPWRLFGGFAFGYGQVGGPGYAGAPSGPQLILSALGSYQATRWVVDAGCGWMWSSFSGASAGGPPIEVRPRAGLVELSPRARLGQHVSLGPALDLTFGADAGFGPVVQSASPATALAGARVVYEVDRAAAGLPVRLVAQWLTDFSVAARRAWIATTGLQLGLPFFGPKAPPSDVIVVTSAAPARDLRVSLDPGKVFFSTASTRMRASAREHLRAIGRLLAHEPSSWRAVNIDGHADRRGSYGYNLRLSRLRARSVLEALVDGGADRARLRSAGYSFLKPVDASADGPGAWARDRRVEIVFRDVTNPSALERLIREMEEGPEP
jgi:outer membrane protein OmpA-like peptidoglycan-associated protein